ncbi:MAG TPA: hypothetical protein VNN08_24740 [Thermoanaerobaculia bacterium]|nr:hypothetical protein [Thermoanaerobaculia bacterium]
MPTKNRPGKTIAARKPSTTTPSVIPDPVAAAARMIELITEMEAIIPDLVQPDHTRIGRIAQSAKFARPLIPTAITAVNSYEPFQKLFDAAAGQGALDYDNQLNPITKRLAALTLALSYSSNLKIATAGDEAMQLYQWAKRHVKQPNGGGARTYVDDMQRVVERTINRRKPQNPASTPPSTTPPNTSPNTPPTTPPTQGFLAPSLAAKAQAAPDPVDPIDDETLDYLLEIAGLDPKK